MGLDRIVCLANSYKHGPSLRCRNQSLYKAMVRLTGQQVPGCLTRKEASYPDGKEVALLDVFEAELGERCGSNCHPEDVYVTGQARGVWSATSTRLPTSIFLPTTSVRNHLYCRGT